MKHSNSTEAAFDALPNANEASPAGMIRGELRELGGQAPESEVVVSGPRGAAADADVQTMPEQRRRFDPFVPTMLHGVARATLSPPVGVSERPEAGLVVGKVRPVGPPTKPPPRRRRHGGGPMVLEPSNLEHDPFDLIDRSELSRSALPRSALPRLADERASRPPPLPVWAGAELTSGRLTPGRVSLLPGVPDRFELTPECVSPSRATLPPMSGGVGNAALQAWPASSARDRFEAGRPSLRVSVIPPAPIALTPVANTQRTFAGVASTGSLQRAPRPTLFQRWRLTTLTLLSLVILWLCAFAAVRFGLLRF